MKWYKKQLDLLKVSKTKPSEIEEKNVFVKTPAYPFRSHKNLHQVKKFRSPVAESKKSRSKTDK